MRCSLPAQLTLLLLACSEQVAASLAHGSQQVLLAPQEEVNEAATATSEFSPVHAVDDTILAALAANPDPVDALISLRPEMAAHLASARLIHVLGEDKARWMAEGDKLRLRRDRKKFMDITDHQELYTEGVGAWSGKASACDPPRLRDVVVLRW
jgi:bacterial leucyl aminopeptidase